MKSKKLTYLLILLLFFGKSYSQEFLNCHKNFDNARLYLKYGNVSKKDSIKVFSLLQPCINKHNESALLISRLYLKSNNKKNQKKGVNIIKKLAKNGYHLAAYDLANLYKYGKYLPTNQKRAVKWFKIANQKGHKKASYSIGYMYLKGFGGFKQNYKTAFNWFQKSDYPMSNFWQFNMIYNGLGVKEDKKRAIKFLKNNKIPNKKFILSTLKSNKRLKLTKEELKVLQKKGFHLAENQIMGGWKGELLHFDWSKTKLINRTPIKLHFYDNDGELKYFFQKEKNKMDNDLIITKNSLELNEFEFEIANPYPITVNSKKISYKAIQTDGVFIKNNDDIFLKLNIESFIPKWNEKGMPITLLLKKEKLKNEISDDLVLKKLNSQKNNFVKIYPVPFDFNFFFSFELKNKSRVTVFLSNTKTNKKEIIIKNKILNKGLYNYEYYPKNITNGIYIINVVVNGKIYKRTLIKQN